MAALPLSPIPLPSPLLPSRPAQAPWSPLPPGFQIPAAAQSPALGPVQEYWSILKGNESRILIAANEEAHHDSGCSCFPLSPRWKVQLSLKAQQIPNIEDYAGNWDPAACSGPTFLRRRRAERKEGESSPWCDTKGQHRHSQPCSRARSAPGAVGQQKNKKKN